MTSNVTCCVAVALAMVLPRAGHAATATWSSAVTFGAPGSPTVATLAATNVQATSAWLNGSLNTTGATPTTVRVYWATTDQYPNYAGWLGSNEWDAVSSTGTLT